MQTHPPGPPSNGNPRLITRYRGENFDFFMSEGNAHGATPTRWGVSRHGEPVLMKPFTTAAEMTADLKALVAELRLANDAQQSAVRHQTGVSQPREFASVLVGIWGDKNPPWKNQWVQVPPGELDPEKCRMTPCLGPEPRPSDARPLYPVARKVRDQPELAVIEDWSHTLKESLTKAEILDQKRHLVELGLGPKPVSPVKAQGPTKTPKVNQEHAAAPEVPPEVWPVVRHPEPFSPGTAMVAVEEVFPRREDALKFAEGREDRAVFPNALQAGLKKGDKLLAELDPNPKGENAEKLNRMILGGGPVTRQKQPRQVQTEKPSNTPAEPQPDHEDVIAKGFRPILVETPAVPRMEERDWAVVRVVGVHGEEGAVFEVEKVTKSHYWADLSALGRKDRAVFPRSFPVGAITKGRWFVVESVKGYEDDPNVRKIHRMLEKERALTPAPLTARKQTQEKRQEPGLSQGL